MVLKSALVLAAIWELEAALAVHFSVQPLADVPFAVRPNVGTLAFHRIVLELTLVNCSIYKHKFSIALFFTLLKITLVLEAIREDLDTMALLLAVFPFAVID